MTMQPIIAVTTGEPAGIGPELCAMLAERAHGYAARLVLIGDRDVLESRASRIGRTPRFVDYMPGAAVAPEDGIEVWHTPLAVPTRAGQWHGFIGLTCSQRGAR